MTDLLKKIEAFNKRWGIAETSSYEEEFKKFKTRVMNILKEIDDLVTREGAANVVPHLRFGQV